MEMITYDEFKKMDIRIGTIREIEPIDGADKRLRCQIDFGEKALPVSGAVSEPIDSDSVTTDDASVESDMLVDQNETPERDIRQIISGIREYYPDYETLIGKQVLYIVNLEPRTIRGHVSHGMLMAVGDDRPIFLVPDEPVTPGSRVR